MGSVQTWAVMVCLALSGGAVIAAKAPKEPQKDRAEADALFTQSNVLRLRLEIAKPDLDSLRKNPRKYVKVTLREGDAVFEDVGVHLKGSAGSFRQVDDKPGLTFNMAAFEASSRFHGLRKFHLNNSVQDGSCLSEFVSGELFRAAGVPAARAGLALVELNGRKLGLYVFLESMDRDFLARDFHNTKGNLYGQAGGCEITDAIERMEGRGPLDRADLKGLAAAINEPNPAKRWERVQKALDVDRFLSFMALEVMLCHWDGYTFARHNYRVYHDLDTDRMVFLPHDLDQLMQDSNVPIVPGVNGWVSQTMVRTPETRDRYRARFGAIFTNLFVVSALTNRINQRVAQVMPVLKAADAGLAQNFQNNCGNLKSRIVNRAQALERQFNLPGPLKFENNVAKLKGWKQVVSQGNANCDETKLDGKPVLHIKCETGGGIASWRANVTLDQGRYRFSGQAKCAGVVPDEGGAGGGGGLRDKLSRRNNKLSGDANWTLLEHEFEEGGDNRQVELVCDLRAKQGEIWFDASSLKLERLK